MRNNKANLRNSFAVLEVFIFRKLQVVNEVVVEAVKLSG